MQIMAMPSNSRPLEWFGGHGRSLRLER